MYNYPLSLSFKVVVFNPQVRVIGADGQPVFYVKQKALALKEDVKIFTNDTMSTQLYQIKADKIIDWSPTYTITAQDNSKVGAVKRQGMKSIWKASYKIVNAEGKEIGSVREEKPWLKVLDALLSEIPFLAMLVNPAYLVELNGKTVLKLQKKPAVFEGKFEVIKLADISDTEEKLIAPAVVMIMMMERMRG